jgi:hypothetical protein
MTDEEVEDIIRSNMNLQMNLAGIRADFEEKLQRTWVNMTADEVDQGLLKTNYVMKTAEAWRHGVEWAQFNLMRKNT